MGALYRAFFSRLAVVESLSDLFDFNVWLESAYFEELHGKMFNVDASSYVRRDARQS